MKRSHSRWPAAECIPITKKNCAPCRRNLASPVACNGIFVDLVDRLFLNALKKGQDLATYAWEALRARNQVMVKNGKPLGTIDENLQELKERATLFTEKRLPRLQKLGIG